MDFEDYQAKGHQTPRRNGIQRPKAFKALEDE
jgi:hypothetical protein